MKNEQIAIYGAGGFEREVAWLVQSINDLVKYKAVRSAVKDMDSKTLKGLWERWGMRWHEMPHKFVADFWQKKEISIKGGKQRLDFIHIKDVISGICCVLKTNNNQNNGLYNLGCGNSVAIRDLADCVNKAAEQIGLEKVPIRIVPGKDERKFGMDTTLFCGDFNWCPDVSLEEGMRELVQAAEKRNLFIQN